MTTPFGVPVDPDVNRIWAASCSVFLQSGGVGGYPRMSSNVKLTLKFFPVTTGSASSQPTETDFRNRSFSNLSSRRLVTGPPASIHLLSEDAIILARRLEGQDVSSGT